MIEFPYILRDITKFPHSFVVSVNDLIKRSSEGSAVCFLNLPVPPGRGEPAATNQRYMESLRLLTQDLPPTLLVHGLTSVISMAL